MKLIATNWTPKDALQNINDVKAGDSINFDEGTYLERIKAVAQVGAALARRNLQLDENHSVIDGEGGGTPAAGAVPNSSL
jgi:hypothetical protein